MADTTTPITVNWTPPLLEALNFSDCVSATRWLGAGAVSLSKRKQEGIADIQLSVILNYLASMIPQTYASKPTDADLAAWYLTEWTNATYPPEKDIDLVLQQAWVFPITNCSRQQCAALEWEGDADVSGVGMMISYYMAAILATIYFALLVTGGLGGYFRERWRQKYGVAPDHDSGQLKEAAKPQPSASKRAVLQVYVAFGESINTFLDAALIFAVAMLAAAVYRYAAFFRHPTEEVSTYSLLASVFMSVFSILPAVVLQSAADDLRGHWLRQFLWFLVLVFTITVGVMYRAIDFFSYNTDALNGTSEIDPVLFARFREIIWLTVCEDDGLRGHLNRTLKAGYVILGVNAVWWFYIVLASIVPAHKKAWIHKSRAHAMWTHGYPFFRIANGFISGILMWTFLGLFQRYRRTIRERTGPADQDGKWTFGQVLALATWVPVLVDLVAIGISGPEWGLSEKISSRYRVVATSADEGDAKGAAGRSNMAFFMPEVTHRDKQLEHRDAVRTGV